MMDDTFTRTLLEIVLASQEELQELEDRSVRLQAKIFELECMRDNGLTPAESARIAETKRSKASEEEAREDEPMSPEAT